MAYGNVAQTLLDDPGAELKAQEDARRRQALAQQLQQQQQFSQQFADPSRYMNKSEGGGGLLASLLSGAGQSEAPSEGGSVSASSAGGEAMSPAPVTGRDFGKSITGGVSMRDIAAMALRNGASPEEAATLAAISRPESGGNPNAYNGKGRDDSYGLLQVNMLGGMGPERRARYGLTDNKQLLDPETNIKVGLDLAHRRGNFKDWSTFLNGSYKRYMPEALQAVQMASGSMANDASPQRAPQGPQLALNASKPQATPQVAPQAQPAPQVAQSAPQSELPDTSMFGKGTYRETKDYGGHGLLGLAQNLVMNAIDGGPPAPDGALQALASSKKASDRYLALMADESQTPQARQVYQHLYNQATISEKASEKQFGEAYTNEVGQLVQKGANGQIHVINTPSKAHEGVNHRHVVGGDLVDDDGKVIYSKRAPESLFSEEAEDDAAHALNLGDDSHLKNLGRGAQGPETIARIRNKSAKFRRESDQSVADIMANQAKYGGDKARERVLGQQEGNAVTSAIEAGNSLVIARKAVDALGNSELPSVNMAINAYKNQTGKPEVQAFGQAAATLANTYARAVNPKGLPHESVLRDAIERMSGARSPQQLHAIMDIMQQEIEMAVNAPRQAREAIKGMDNGVQYKVPGGKTGGKTSGGLDWSVD